VPVPAAKLAAGLEQDIHKVAERKRGEADRAHFELNKALRELYALQSKMMMLERDNAIIDSQLRRRSTGGGGGAAAAAGGGGVSGGGMAAAASRRPVATMTPSSSSAAAAAATAAAPSGGDGLGLTSGALVAAVYETDGIRGMVEELEGIKVETAEIEFRGQIYEHMRARLADEVVECRRQARFLQDRVAEERGRNGDLHRKEMESLRHLAVSQARLTAMRKDVEGQLAHWKTEIRERSAYIRKKREFNAYLESQLGAPPAPSPPAAVSERWDATAVPSLPVAAAHSRAAFLPSAGGAPGTVMTARTIKRRVSHLVSDPADSDGTSTYVTVVVVFGASSPLHTHIPQPPHPPMLLQVHGCAARHGRPAAAGTDRGQWRRWRRRRWHSDRAGHRQWWAPGCDVCGRHPCHVV